MCWGINQSFQTEPFWMVKLCYVEYWALCKFFNTWNEMWKSSISFSVFEKPLSSGHYFCPPPPVLLSALTRCMRSPIDGPRQASLSFIWLSPSKSRAAPGPWGLPHGARKCLLSCSGETEDLNRLNRTSLLVPWMRIHLLVHGTWVWFLVQEESTCLTATKPRHHKYWNPSV